MDMKTLDQIVAMAEETGHVFLLTADGKGVPHLTTAGTIRHVQNDLVSVTEWLCPITVKNLSVNPNVSVAVWNIRNDEGFQLKGEFQGASEVGMVDGYVAEDDDSSVPQVLRNIIIRITGIFSFAKLVHADREVKF